MYGRSKNGLFKLLVQRLPTRISNQNTPFFSSKNHQEKWKEEMSASKLPKKTYIFHHKMCGSHWLLISLT
jgi:hypothetical protein